MRPRLGVYKYGHLCEALALFSSSHTLIHPLRQAFSFSLFKPTLISLRYQPTLLTFNMQFTKSTVSQVSFSNEESDKNLPRNIRQVWRNEFEQLALKDIQTSQFGAQRHSLSASDCTLTYRIDASPLTLHRVGVHPYGGPINDLYDTPTLYEVLEDVKVWITYNEIITVPDVQVRFSLSFLR